MKITEEQVTKILCKSNRILCTKCTNDNVRDQIRWFRDQTYGRNKEDTIEMIKAYRSRSMCQDCMSYNQYDLKYVTDEINKLIGE